MSRNERALRNEQDVSDFAMSFDEIARALNMKLGTVWAIYQRGLRKLRQLHPGILQDLREAAQELDANRREDDV